MIDPESEERALLEAVRRALSPSAADVSRVLHATRAKLAANDAGDASGEGPSAVGHAPRVGLARPWVVQLVGALSIAAASGVIGFALGRRSVEPAAPAPSNVVAQTAPPGVGLVPTAPAETARPTAEVARRDEVAPPPAETSPRSAAQERSAPIRTPRGAREASPSSLKEELDTMRRVDRLLHDREPRRALALLYELDRSVPEGQLRQEREAAFAMARCALGLGEPEQLAREFGDRYPGSVYSTRVKQLCLADQRISSGAETHE